jgi:hypothetical protein
MTTFVSGNRQRLLGMCVTALLIYGAEDRLMAVPQCSQVCSLTAYCGLACTIANPPPDPPQFLSCGEYNLCESCGNNYCNEGLGEDCDSCLATVKFFRTNLHVEAMVVKRAKAPSVAPKTVTLARSKTAVVTASVIWARTSATVLMIAHIQSGATVPANARTGTATITYALVGDVYMSRTTRHATRILWGSTAHRPT